MWCFPWGKKACGGPDGYIVVSHQNPRFKQLVALLKRHAKKRSLYGARIHELSACDGRVIPLAQCNQGACQAVYPSGAWPWIKLPDSTDAGPLPDAGQR